MSSYSEKARGPLQKGRDLLNRLYEGGPTKAQRILGSASTLLTPNPFVGLCGVNDRLPLTAEQI